MLLEECGAFKEQVWQHFSSLDTKKEPSALSCLVWLYKYIYINIYMYVCI